MVCTGVIHVWTFGRWTTREEKNFAAGKGNKSLHILFTKRIIVRCVTFKTTNSGHNFLQCVYELNNHLKITVTFHHKIVVSIRQIPHNQIYLRA